MVTSSRGLDNSGVYTDVQGLSALRSEAHNGSTSASALKKVAHQFESVFMNMVLKSMRDANSTFSKDNPFESQQSEFYQQMFDNQLSLSLSQKNSLGVADMIIKQMSKFVKGMDLENKTDPSSIKHLPNIHAKYKNSVVTGIAPVLSSSSLVNNNELADIQSQILKDVNLSDSERLYLDEPVNMADEESANKIATHTKVESFDSPEKFVSTLYPIAKQAAAELGVDPKILLSQAALETGWGKHVMPDSAGNSSYNLFNIKSNENWIGDKVSVDTVEFKDGKPLKEKAQFKVYDSLEESFSDYVQLLKNSKRYQTALKNADNPFAFARSLQQAGYATDPEYAGKISRIYSGSTMDAAVDQNAKSETNAVSDGGGE